MEDNEKEPNIIIITKPGINSTKNNHSYLTLKKGEYILSIDIDNSINSKLNKQKIFQTLSDLRSHLEDKTIKRNSIKNRLIKHHINSNNTIKGAKDIKLKEKIINNDDTRINNKNKEFPSIIITNEDKLSENKKNIESKKAENLKEIEENFTSSINKKSIKTQLNKKDKQKSIQQSDRAEISKANSDSDNVTEYDNKIKMIVKYRLDNGQSIKCDINEIEEFENELIDNDKDIITVLNNNNNNNKNNNKKNNDKEEKIIFKQDTISIKKNNFLDDEKNEKLDNKNDNNKIISKDSDKENNKNNLIEISKDNKISNDNSIVNDNISEHKKLMPLIPEGIVKKNNLGENNEAIQSSYIKAKPITIVNKKNLKKTVNSNLISSNRDLKVNESTRVYYKPMQMTQKNCYICEKPFYLSKLFCADCCIHFLCRKCIKNYYEDYIENKNNTKILKCPNTKCDKLIDYEILKTIISENHQRLYELDKSENKALCKNNGIYNSMKLSLVKDDKNNAKKYTEKHVLDINSNMNFFMYKKSKDIFCPKCLNPNLFSKTNNHFIKCLNCDYKICKYCLKEYTLRHLDMKIEGYCKVHYRSDEKNEDEKNIFFIYFLQLFFVISMYILTYCGSYLFFYNNFKAIFGLNNKNKNCSYFIKKFLNVLFSSILFLITCPFIIILYPFFPAVIASFDS